MPITASQSSLMTFDTPIIPLFFLRPQHLYQAGREQLFGALDERSAKILSNLSSEQGITFQIYCRTINRRAAQGKRGGRKPGANELQYVMNTIIYGPIELCDPVGEYLSKCGVYLQDPLNCDRDVVYSNPQVICRTTEVVMTSSLVSQNAAPEVEKVISREDLFSELCSDDHLSLTDAPDAVSTPLYT